MIASKGKTYLGLAILWVAIMISACAPPPHRLVVFEAFVDPA
jgi:hypothetical protein